MFTTISLIVGVLTLLYFAIRKYMGRNDKIWLDQGVPFLKLSEIASLFARITFRVSFLEVDKRIYDRVGTEKFISFVEFGEPIIYIKDLDLLRQIMVKDFDHFSDRRVMDFSKSDEVFSRMLTNTVGQEWKDLRSVVSPTFTTGKIKRMFDLFNVCGDQLTKYLKTKRQISDTCDFQEAFGRFTLSAIAVIAFGQETDAFEDDSTFRKMAKDIFTPSIMAFVKGLCYLMFPKLAKAMKISVSNQVPRDFFASIIEQNMKQRRAEGETSPKRNDFLQLLLEAQAGQLKTEDLELGTFEKDAVLKEGSGSEDARKVVHAVMDDITIKAQSILFFLAGSDTLESALTMVAYELALNPDVQEKLANEIQGTLKRYNGQLTYEAVNEMEYLDMVLSESLRLYPPAFLTERWTAKEYTIPDSRVVIPKKARVMIPIRQIQQDPKYYENPLKFNPENFSRENKSKRHPYAYLPFGQGPRNCVAMRFALIEAKAAIVHLIRSFKIDPSEKTPIPFKHNFKSGILKPADGMWLTYTLRQD